METGGITGYYYYREGASTIRVDASDLCKECTPSSFKIPPPVTTTTFPRLCTRHQSPLPCFGFSNGQLQGNAIEVVPAQRRFKAYANMEYVGIYAQTTRRYFLSCLVHGINSKLGGVSTCLQRQFHMAPRANNPCSMYYHASWGACEIEIVSCAPGLKCSAGGARRRQKKHEMIEDLNGPGSRCRILLGK